MRIYRVWTRYQNIEDGCDVAAESSFSARKQIAEQRNVSITDVMARRVVEPDSHNKDYGKG